MHTNKSNIIKTNTLAMIHFIERKIESLEHDLPETYRYLQEELDSYNKSLAEIEVLERSDVINKSCSDYQE